MQIRWFLCITLSFFIFTLDGCGGGGGGGGGGNNAQPLVTPPPAANTPPVPPPDESPTISLDNPEDDSTVSGTVSLRATASDDNGIDSVGFFVDDELLLNDSTEPYEATWETNTLFDGAYSLKAIVTDTNQQESESGISVIVQNGLTTKLYGADTGLFRGEQDPNQGSSIPDDQIYEMLHIVRHKFNDIRSFGTGLNQDAIVRIANELQLCIAVGIWLDNNATTNENEIVKAIDASQSGCIRYIVVGSETLLRGDLTLAELIAIIEDVRSRIPGIPITTGEIYPNWINNPELVDAVDVLFVNYYAFWEGIALDRGIGALNFYNQDVLAISNGKQVIVSETGWPSCGEPVGNAIPSPENAALYFMNFVSWAESVGQEYYYFEAFDEPWKGNSQEGSRGACWGIWDTNLNLKPGMQAVFDGERMDDNWTVVDGIPGGEGVASIELTNVPPYGSFDDVVGRVQHVDPRVYAVVLYIDVVNRFNSEERWWVKPFANAPLTNIAFDGTFVIDYTTGGIDEFATKLHTFLIPRTYAPPILLGAHALPQELFENSVADVRVLR